LMSLNDKVDRVVVPGEIIGHVGPDSGMGDFVLGPGLIQNRDFVIVSKAGVLRCKNPHTYFIENNQKRYIPSPGDLVIGVITDILKDEWKVDIGYHQFAYLSFMSFEGATKRNKKVFHVGTVIYAMVSVAGRDMEPEIVCMSRRGKSEGFGELIDGYMFKSSLGLARQCLDSNSVVLSTLGMYVPYEIAVGANGRIWVKSNTPLETILISNAIINSEYLSNTQTREMVELLIRKTKSRR